MVCCDLGQVYLFIFWTPTLCLVGGDENVGGDEERSVLSRRNHIVCFVPHSVEPVGHLPQSMLVTIISPFCNRESHIITHNHTMWFQFLLDLFLRRKWFQTRRCPLSHWLLSPSPASQKLQCKGTNR